MKPSLVCRRILEDHQALRGQLIRADRVARKVLDGEPGNGEKLRGAVIELETALREHYALEEEILAPVIAQTDAWGPQRAERFEDDHRRQGEILAVLDRGARGGEPELGVALMLWGFVRLLLLEMAEEERVFVNEEVLRDDLVRLDV